MVSTVHDAVRFLAGRCDYANMRDNVGYNGYDAPFMHSLADQRSLSPKQEAAAFKILKKYRRQLMGAGIDYFELKKPAESRPRRGREVKWEESHKRLVITFPYDPALVEAVKEIPDRRWDKDRKVWTTPIERCLEVEQFAKANKFSISEAAQNAIDGHKLVALAEADRVEAAVAASEATDADIELPVEGLYPFQKAGVQYMLDRRRTFNADEMGVGKSVQTLTTIEAANAFPVLIIAPKTVIPAWQDEARRWLPHRTVETVTAQSAFVGESDITLIHYDVIARRLDDLAPPTGEMTKVGVKEEPKRTTRFKSLALDEAHFLKSKGALRTKSVRALSRCLNDPDPIILALSGTPLVNRPAELITQLAILRRLGDVGGFRKFWTRYCNASRDGAQHLNELNVVLRETCMVRRLKSDVLLDLPPRTWATVRMPLSNRKEYKYAHDAFLRWLKDQGDPDRFNAALRAEAIVRLTNLRKLSAEGKLEAAKEWISDFLRSDGKLVVFAHHRDCQESLLDALEEFHPVRIFGGDSTEDRAAAIRAFQEDDEVRVIVCSLRAAGQGITLTASSNVAFLELDWTPGGMQQAVDRCHRIGQRDAVTGWQLVAPDTIDDDLQEILAEKRQVLAQVLDGRAADEEQTSAVNDLIRRMQEEE